MHTIFINSHKFLTLMHSIYIVKLVKITIFSLKHDVKYVDVKD